MMTFGQFIGSRLTVALLAVVLLMLAPAAAHAALGVCRVSATNIIFQTFTGTEVTATGTITVTCDGGSGNTNVNVRLTTGSSGRYTPTRTMKSGVNILNYQIYTDSTRSNIFGDGSGGTTKPRITISYGKPAAPSVTVQLSMFAVIPVQALPPFGAYIDTIGVNLEQQPAANSTFLVTENGPVTCSVTANNLNFGAYAGAQLDGATTLSATCTSSAPYNIGLNQGVSAGATVTTRRLTGPAGALLSYSLFRNSARTTNWGNTVGTDTVPATGTGVAQTFTVFGRIPASQPQPPGAYSDTITVTLFF